MAKKYTLDVDISPDPLVLAARAAWRRDVAKSVANALDVSLHNARAWVHHVQRVPKRWRYQLALAIVAEIRRQDAEERREARLVCSKEIGGNHGKISHPVASG